MYYERLIYDILTEEDFKARSAKTNRIVRFGSKEAMKAAIKKGTHAPLDKKKVKPGSVFDPEKPTGEPDADKTGELDGDDEVWSLDQQIADIEKSIEFADKQAEKTGSSYWDKESARLANVLKNMQKEKEAQDAPKGKKPWHKIKGDDTMGHLSKKLKQKVLHSLEDVNLSHTQKFDLEIDDDNNVTYDGVVVAKIDDDTTHEDLRNQIKTNVTNMWKAREVKDSMEYAEEGILDAVSRGMDYGDPDVQDMVRDDIEAAKEAGATVKDFEELANKLQDPEASEIIKDALEDVYGDAGNLADPDMDNPGYEDEEDSEAKAEESEAAIDDAIENKIPQSMDQFDQTKEEIFDEIINLIGDEDEYADIVDNIDSTDPENYPLSATFNIAHHVVRAAIARGELDRDSDSMEVANFLETYEEDLYDRIMESSKPWKTQYNRLFESLGGI